MVPRGHTNNTRSVRVSARPFGSPSSLYSSRWPYRQLNGTDAIAHAVDSWMVFDGTKLGENLTLKMIFSTTFNPRTLAELSFASELITYQHSFIRTGNRSSILNSTQSGWP
ncbi:hypothetical protein BD769DRAFT_1604695 [Suillus cothurnatus]|nr:hypothetical protein BD769DRAFT_1604695 [Suillus cothurnatus]